MTRKVDLNDPDLAAAIVEAVDRVVRRTLAGAVSQIVYGLVTAVNAGAHSCTVDPFGKPAATPGWYYGEVTPIVGDRVRCIVAPSGDRYVDAVLTATLGAPGGVTFGVVGDIVAETFGAAAAAGATGKVADAAHRHGMPADPVTAHVAAADPHTGYVLESAIGLVADIVPEASGSAAAAGATGRFADAGHRHGMPTLQSLAAGVVGDITASAPGDAAAAGATGKFADAAHKHGREAAKNSYALNVAAASQATTTDAQTLYWGGLPAVAPDSTAAVKRVYIPKTGVIKAAYIYARAGTIGTNEAWAVYIRVNNGADTLIQSLGAATADRLWSNAALAIAVNAGDYVEIKEVCPTWATNPATVTRMGVLYVE